MADKFTEFEKRASAAIAAENVIVLKEGESVTGEYAGTITKTILGKERKIVSVICADGINRFYWSWGLLGWHLDEVPPGSMVRFALSEKRKNKKTGQMCNGCKFYAEAPDGSKHAAGEAEEQTEEVSDGILPF